MRTLLRIGPNTSRCLSCTPIAARLAHGEKCRVGFVIDSFMVMVLLSSGSVPSIGMTHHRSFRKSFSAGSTLPLLWTKFRQLALFDDETFRQSMTTAVDLMWLVESRPSQTVEQVKEQEQLYTTMRDGLMRKYGRIANLIVAVNYGVTVDASLWKPLVDYATGRILTAPAQFEEWLKAAGAIASEQRHRFFHWELEFPEVFFDRYGQSRRSLAGFDAVVGNPPWIRQEAFSEDKPAL